MRHTVTVGILFGLLAAYLGWLTWARLRSGVFVGRYGRVVRRTEAPRRFWAAVVLQSIFLLGAVLASAAAFLSPRR